MIIDGWFAAIDRKGDVIGVEASEDAAHTIGRNYYNLKAGNPDRHTVVPVALIVGKPGEAFEVIVERVVERVRQDDLNPVPVYKDGKEPEKGKQNPTDL